jgi:phosphatidate cytidylyltransferase
LYSPIAIRLSIICLFIAFIFFETAIKNKKRHLLAITYGVLLSICLLQAIFISSNYDINLLITIAICSVLSDVAAYFFGNYLGNHKLPAFLNNKKSWEGVAGQLLGALIGVFVVGAFLVPNLPLIIFIPIGVGSALGDLLNSYIKRRLDVKDWSNYIPGHGGFADRLSSMSLSILFAFYFVLIFIR